MKSICWADMMKHAPPRPPNKPARFGGKPRHVIGICAFGNKEPYKTDEEHFGQIAGKQCASDESGSFRIDSVYRSNDFEWADQPMAQPDALIAFYSAGFPPGESDRVPESQGNLCVNDLVMQYVLQDRRLTLLILEAIDVPTPKRIWLNSPRDSPCRQSFQQSWVKVSVETSMWI